jgi:nucleotide-binding universal stress UspA family protein
MVFLKKILIPTDLSEFSMAAMDFAESFGDLYSSKICVLHVLDSKESHQRSDDEALKELEQFIQIYSRTPARLTMMVRKGVPADEIRRFADEEGIDLIIMATHGRTGLRHVLMGSVAEKTVRLASVPVLTVKPLPMVENLLKNEDVEKELHLR